MLGFVPHAEEVVLVGGQNCVDVAQDLDQRGADGLDLVEGVPARCNVGIVGAVQQAISIMEQIVQHLPDSQSTFNDKKFN
jgi:hypothetical protein